MAKFTTKHGHNLLPPADLVKEIERLHESLNNERDRHLRTFADFKNYRSRVERDGIKLAEEGKRVIILPFLDIIDDLEKLLLWKTNGDQAFVKSVQIIHQKLLALLESHEVLPFDSVGEVFTPILHEAVAVVEDEDVKPGSVVDELRRGYLWKNKLLRPAQVRVAG